MLQNTRVKLAQMSDKNYFQGDNTEGMETTPERFYDLLNNYLDSHNRSRSAAANELSAATGISPRMIIYYAAREKEATLANFFKIMDAIGRQVQDFPKE